MQRAVWCLTVVLALSAGWASAQPLTVTGPPDRFAPPGGFVTLVFRVLSPVAVEVDATANVDLGWTVLRSPGRIDLPADESVPIALTVEVPRDAPAGALGRVTLRVVAPGGSAERTVDLSVTERIEVTLEAPAEVTIGPKGLEVEVANAGNVAEALTIEPRLDGAELGFEDLALEPGARATVRFDLVDEGLHEVLLTSAGGAAVRRTVRVLRFGSAADASFSLQADVAAAFGTSGRRAFAFGLQGPLSDFTTVDARVDGGDWGRSYAEARGEAWSVRLGSGWRDPFGLQLPGDLGLGAVWFDDEHWAAAGQVGWLGEDRFGSTWPPGGSQRCSLA